jgi:pimeloyl-[acyl-carrier protein] synthase
MQFDNRFLSTPDFIQDPYPTYHYLQENDPVHWMPFGEEGNGMWMVTRFDDALNLFKSPSVIKDVRRVGEIEEKPSPLGRNMLDHDPPEHTRLRSLVNLAFTPARVRDLEPRITAIVEEVYATARKNGGMDFIDSFAILLPVKVICELLGVPASDQQLFRNWMTDIIAGIDAVYSSKENQQKQMNASMALAEYFQALILERRKDLQEDLISGLIAAHDSGDRLSDGELLGMCFLLLTAGHETTVNLLGNGLLTLLRNPEEIRRLVEDPGQIDSAIEEMLRYESPLQRATTRFTAEDIHINGQVIKKGEQVSAVIGAANRDPAHFTQPDQFDITRKPNRHLAFGQGVHFCVGAPLSRAEARIAFSHILDDLPTFRLVSEQVDWRQMTWMRGLRSLQIEF